VPPLRLLPIHHVEPSFSRRVGVIIEPSCRAPPRHPRRVARHHRLPFTPLSLSRPYIIHHHQFARYTPSQSPSVITVITITTEHVITPNIQPIACLPHSTFPLIVSPVCLAVSLNTDHHYHDTPGHDHAITLTKHACPRHHGTPLNWSAAPMPAQLIYAPRMHKRKNETLSSYHIENRNSRRRLKNIIECSYLRRHAAIRRCADMLSAHTTRMTHYHA